MVNQNAWVKTGAMANAINNLYAVIIHNQAMQIVKDLNNSGTGQGAQFTYSKNILSL